MQAYWMLVMITRTVTIWNWNLCHFLIPQVCPHPDCWSQIRPPFEREFRHFNEQREKLSLVSGICRMEKDSTCKNYRNASFTPTLNCQATVKRTQVVLFLIRQLLKSLYLSHVTKCIARWFGRIKSTVCKPVVLTSFGMWIIVKHYTDTYHLCSI